MDMIRILALADTHLGFDYPFKPRIRRRRRGPDFFANFEQALEPALNNSADLVIHGGDIFFRSKIPGKLVDMVFTRLHRVADRGIPVYMVPGNHERSRIPYRLLAEHPNIFIFDEPLCYRFERDGFRIALAGFPFIRNEIRNRFPAILKETGWRDMEADCYLLCCHQSVEGAITGPHNYIFRHQKDVVNVQDIPSRFSAVITGHMHRFQIIESDLRNELLPAPVFYPGSIERTSFAEKDETKGYLTIDIRTSGSKKGKLTGYRFHELPARPMIELVYDSDISGFDVFEGWLQIQLSNMPLNSIIRIRVRGVPGSELYKKMRAESLRSMIPESMNIGVKLVGVT
jgi:DNA repair exonuclease SbcCD nuclease subunit